MNYKHTFLFLLGLFCAQILPAQDIHFSQFNRSPLNFNPALTGIFDGDKRVAINFRQQWKSVPVNYFTMSGAYDMNIMPKKMKKGFFGLGVQINFDRAGDGLLQLFEGALSGSYTHMINSNNLITLGLQTGYASRGLTSQRDLQYDNQFDGWVFDQNLPTGENFDRTSLGQFNLSGGLNYRLQKDKRTKIDLGLASFRFIIPDYSFYAEDVDLPIRFSTYAMGSLSISSVLDIYANVLAQFQGPDSEFLPSAGIKFYVNQKPGSELAISLGGVARLNSYFDAIAPQLAVDYNQWTLGVTYDLNISDFSAATNRKGGPEISIIYRLKEVKSLGTFKTCPIF